MAKRRISAEPADLGDTADIEYYRDKLAIDRVNLDDCLVEQPELYYHVANNHVLAAAERDAAKIEYDDAFAEEDNKLRKRLADEEAAAEDEDNPKKKKGRGAGPGGMTETAIKNQLTQLARLRDLQWAYFEKKKAADLWSVLKEGFGQRSKMLPELVALMLSQWRDHAIANAGNKARGDMSDNIREQAGKLRSQKRFGRDQDD